MRVAFNHMALGAGRVTFAYEVVDGEAIVGAAFCSPKDQFSRRKGRLIATGRMMRTPLLRFPVAPGAKDSDIRAAIRWAISNEKLEYKSSLPTWAFKAPRPYHEPRWN